MRHIIKEKLEKIINENKELIKNNYSNNSIASFIASKFSSEITLSNGIGTSVLFNNEIIEIICKTISKIETHNDHQIRIQIPAELPYYNINIVSKKNKKSTFHTSKIKNKNIVVMIQLYRINDKIEAIFAYILPKSDDKIEVKKMCKYFTISGDRKLLTLKNAINDGDLGAYFYSYSDKNVNEYF